MLERISESVFRSNVPTPNGGAYSKAFYSNHKGPCKPEEATDVLIIEYDEKDNPIYHIHGMTKR